ncbi:MAG TPA: hypothetical protein VEL47_04140, partial [Myxococcota bacterium]|nr:hypothetical protein [Myxococcota bacterium]
LAGVFLPWVSGDGFLTQTGLMGGGDVHMFLAFYAIYQVHKVARCQVRAFKKIGQLAMLGGRLRRISLSYVLVGLASLLASIFVLVYCGSQFSAADGMITVRFGFYLTAFSGLLIFFCGLERFRP